VVWNKILGLFKRANTPKIVVSGLKHDAKLFQQSIQEEAEAFAGKASKVLDDVENVTVHAKISGLGKTEKFELYGLLSARNVSFHASASGRKLNFVLKDLFDELFAEARKHKSKLVKGKKKSGGKFVLEVEGE